MIAICEYNECTGCMACYNVCSKRAIKMLPNEEGFLHPVINQEQCVDCGLCAKVCPVNTPVLKKEPQSAFCGWSNDENTRMTSSSGGAFAELAKLILSHGGVVYGVAMDEHIEARHISISNAKELTRLQGSKYNDCIVGDSFVRVKRDLEKNKVVLFSGTPCQVAGLRNFLRCDYDNLYTVDLVCHGVPSPKVFDDYKRYIVKKIKEPIRDIQFRYKKSSWIFFSMGVNSQSKEKGIQKFSYTGGYYSDPYFRAFLKDNILRPNCYNCLYAEKNRVGDFTIADWWKYKSRSKFDKDFEKKGVSLILCNTEKARLLVKRLNMYLSERTIAEAINTNKPLRSPFPVPITRDMFWNDYNHMSFEDLIPKWMSPEKIPLSIYLKIYKENKRVLYSIVNLYERLVRKLYLEKLIIKIQAK